MTNDLVYGIITVSGTPGPQGPAGPPGAGSVVPVSPKTANYTAAAGQVVPCDLSGGSFSVTLPTAPADGSNVVLKIIKQAVSPNTLTFNCGGSDVINVAGGAASGTLVLLNQGVRLQYASAATTGTVGIWYAISTDFPLSQSDLRYLNQNTTGTAAGITGKTTPSGALVGTTDTQALTNKDLTSGNTFPTLNQSTTGTAAGITGKTTPTGAIVGTSDTQTLTNKTLTAPAVSSPTGIVKGDVGLGNVDNTSDSTKNSATAALTNKDLTGAGNTFPTLNQNTTGTAAGITGKTNPSGAIVGTTDTQTLTNKTLTTPAISSPTGLVKGDVGLGNVDNTSDATKTATLDSRYEPLEQFAILQSAYTLTSQTALQQLLNTTTNGAVTLPVGDYFFECGFSLSSMSASSGSFGFGFGGTATFTQAWGALAEKASNIAFGSAGMSWSTTSVANLIAVNTNTNAAALIRGRITVTVAGTVIPQVSLGVAAAAIVGAGSYFRIQSVNSTAAFSGSWT